MNPLKNDGNKKKAQKSLVKNKTSEINTTKIRMQLTF